MTRSSEAWRITWRIGGDARITRVAAPHRKFHTDERDVDLTLPSTLALDVTCTEPPGTEVENTFLILTAESGGRMWRILARMRVRVDAEGVPRPAIERVNVQEVGFSGQR